MKTEELVLHNRLDKRMQATLRLPKEEAKGTVVLLHGLGGWKDQTILKYLAEDFQKNDYITFTFNDSNGVTSLDGKFFDSTQTKYEQDVDDALTYIQKAPWFQGPLILLGHSMGGLAAVDYVATHPTTVAKLLLLAPAISWKSMWFAQLPFAVITLIRGHQTVLGIDERKFILGAGWWRDFFAYDAKRSARRVPVPTLVISAERDYTVAKPREHRRLTACFPHGTHSTVTWANHDFDKHEAEVADTIRQWLTSS